MGAKFHNFWSSETSGNPTGPISRFLTLRICLRYFFLLPRETCTETFLRWQCAMAIGHWPWQLQWRFVGGGAILCGIHLPRGEGEVGRACLRDSRPPHPLDYYPVKNRSRERSLTCVCILHTPIRNNMCTWSCAQSCQQYAQCPCARVFPILGQGLTTEFNQVQTICFLKISIPHVSFADVDIQMQTKKRAPPTQPMTTLCPKKFESVLKYYERAKH